MDRLHQLFRNIKTIISEINDENCGRPKNKSRGRPFTDKIAIQTVLIVLLASIKGMIDQIKNDIGLLLIPNWIRGVRKVRKRVSDKIFAYICMTYCNKLRRRLLHE